MPHLVSIRPTSCVVLLKTTLNPLSRALVAFCLLCSGIATGQTQFSELDTRHLPPVGLQPFHIATGDIDGDGDLDLAIGTLFRTEILKNDGSGHFTQLPSLDTSDKRGKAPNPKFDKNASQLTPVARMVFWPNRIPWAPLSFTPHISAAAVATQPKL